MTTYKVVPKFVIETAAIDPPIAPRKPAFDYHGNRYRTLAGPVLTVFATTEDVLATRVCELVL